MIRVALLVGLCLAAGMGFLQSRETSLAVPGDDPWCPALQPYVDGCSGSTCVAVFDTATPSQKGNCVANTACSWQYRLFVSTTLCAFEVDAVSFRGKKKDIVPPSAVVFEGSISSPCEFTANKVIRFYNGDTVVGMCVANFPCRECPDP